MTFWFITIDTNRFVVAFYNFYLEDGNGFMDQHEKKRFIITKSIIIKYLTAKQTFFTIFFSIFSPRLSRRWLPLWRSWNSSRSRFLSRRRTRRRRPLRRRRKLDSREETARLSVSQVLYRQTGGHLTTYIQSKGKKEKNWPLEFSWSVFGISLYGNNFSI